MKKDTGIPAPPSNCDCGRPGAINMIKVTRNGRVMLKTFSEVRNCKAKGRQLLPQYHFVRWVVECAECFSEKPQEEMFG